MPPPLSKADIPKERKTLKISYKVLVLNGPGALRILWLVALDVTGPSIYLRIGHPTGWS